MMIGRPTVIEIGIVQPSAKSYRTELPGVVADKYGAKKVAKYRLLVEERDGVILPFIVESGGGYDHDAINLLTDIIHLPGEQGAMTAPKTIVQQFVK